jgi:hypothetical protein
MPSRHMPAGDLAPSATYQTPQSQSSRKLVYKHSEMIAHKRPIGEQSGADHV